MPKSGQNVGNRCGVLVDLRRAVVQKHLWESVRVRGWLELALGPNPVRNRLLVFPVYAYRPVCFDVGLA